MSGKNKKDDITKTGALTARDLQKLNNQGSQSTSSGKAISMEDYEQYMKDHGVYNEQVALMDALNTYAQHDDVEAQSSILQNSLRQGRKVDYWGNSFWDNDIAITTGRDDNLGDVRANNQWGIAQIGNGILKAGVLAGTTVLEGAGLLLGVGSGLVTGLTTGDWGEALHQIWDNPITQALQKINDFSEEYLPNYYTKDEMENPWGHIFSANFLGDKLIKNFGFMIGAFYSGMPLSAAIGNIGKARAAKAMEKIGQKFQGAGMRASEIAQDVSKLGLRGAEAEKELAKRFARENLTQLEKGRQLLQGYDKIRRIAETTRATTVAIGSVASAFNEGAIEALNNSRDWEEKSRMEENDRYNELVSFIKNSPGDPEYKQIQLEEAEKEHYQRLAEIQYGKARMGNADLLLNIPILTATNLFALGHLYSRGFDTVRRSEGSLLHLSEWKKGFDTSRRRINDFWNGDKLAGNLRNASLHSSKTTAGGIINSLLKVNSEGLEEYLQRAASEGSGNAVSQSIERYIKAKDEKNHASTSTWEFLSNFTKSIVDQLNDPHAWEEYFIGAVSAALGMPTFGHQAKNVWAGKNGTFGLSGGLVGYYQDYKREWDQEKALAEYLNKRVKSKEFKALYDNLKIQMNLDEFLREAVRNGDKKEFQDIKFEKLFEDINAAASSGHLAEFLEMIDYTPEYTDDELNAIIKGTKKRITKEQHEKMDRDRLFELQSLMDQLYEKSKTEDLTVEEVDAFEEYQKESDEISKRIEEEKYEDTEESDFMDANGDMLLTPESRNKMRSIIEGNRKKIRETIHTYLTLRNDIDVETDGRLEDKDLNFLTKLRASIWDQEIRSSEMTQTLAEWISPVLEAQQALLEEKEKELKDAKEALEKAPKDKKKEAEEKVKSIEKVHKNVGIIVEFLEVLNDTKETSREEGDNIAKGYRGKTKSYREKMKDRLSKLKTFFKNLIEDPEDDDTESNKPKSDSNRPKIDRSRFDSRRVNTDEVQGLLRDETITLVLKGAIVDAVKRKKLDILQASKLIDIIEDLHRLSEDKKEYTDYLAKAIGGKDYINEAFRRAEDKINEEEKNNIIEDLALRIQKARNFMDLDNIMRGARATNTDIAKQAFKKALQDADEETKKFLDEYDEVHSYFTDVANMAGSYPYNVREFILGSLSTWWNDSLDKATHPLEHFKDMMKEAAEIVRKSSDPDREEKAKAIEKIMKDIEDAKAVSTTEKKTTKPSTTNTSASTNPKTDPSSADLARARETKEGSESNDNDKESGEPEDNTPDTREDIINAINKEVRDSISNNIIGISNLSGLSNALRERIGKWNTINKDNKDELIDDNVVNDIIYEIEDELLDAEEKDAYGEAFNNGETPTENGVPIGSSRRADMKKESETSFRNDRVTLYDTRADHKTKVTLEGQELAIQLLLEKYGAFTFIDENLLGIIYSSSIDTPLRLLKSTNKDVNNEDETKSPIFIAIELTDKVKDYIKNATGLIIKPVIINGKEYQLLGTLHVAKNANVITKENFAKFHASVIADCNDKIAQSTDNPEFVVSDYTCDIGQIFTGRLDTADNKNSVVEKTGLNELMEKYNEFINGGEFYFGIVSNHALILPKDFTESNNSFVNPNMYWLQDDKNQGALFIMIRKPDGRFYPIRLTRRSVKDWWKEDKNKAMIENIVSQGTGNTYLMSIIENLDILTDPNKSKKERVEAKTKLTKMFAFRSSPIHFNTASVTLNFKGQNTSIPLKDAEKDTKEDLQTRVTAFFNALASNDILFSLPLPGKINLKISGRDAITADVFEVGLSSMYNYNASFTITPKNGSGEDVNIESNTPNILPFKTERGETFTTTYEGKETAYYLEGDKIYKNGNIVEDIEEYNFVAAAYKAENGQAPTVLSTFINSIYSKAKDKIKEYSAQLFAESKISNLFIIAEDDDYVYIYDKSDNTRNKFTKISKEEYKKMKSDFRNEMMEKTSKKEVRDTILKLQEETSEGENQDSQGPTAESQVKGQESNEGGKPIVNKPPKEDAPKGVWVGKLLDELDDNDVARTLKGSLNRPAAKKILGIFQKAEQGGVDPIVKLGDEIDERIEEILGAPKEDRQSLLDKLSDDLNCK